MHFHRPFAVAIALAVAVPTPVQAAVTPRGQVVALTCTGPVADQGRKIARANGLKHGQHPQACFGRMQIYEGPDRQFVVVAPASTCPGGKALDVYGGSNAGLWHAYFEKPVCGTKLSIGPKDQWGDWMLTVDGRPYDSRGAYYVPAR